MTKSILCIGEILWDSFPEGLFLGGAPFNTALHLHMMGENVTMVSRVGKDKLGTQAIKSIQAKGLSTEFVEFNEKYKTGFVNVELDSLGNATYEIVEPVAWDFIELNDQLIQIAENSDVLIFGSLAQRNVASRKTIQELRRYNLLNVFDVNLRPPYDNLEIVRASLIDSDIVKLNDSELILLAEWFDLPKDLMESTTSLAKYFECQTVCVTRGNKGAAIWHNNSWCEHEGYKVKIQDTVGCGDAFLAALMSGILSGKNNYEILEYANAVGAYVASMKGATPQLELKEINAIKNDQK